MKHSCSRSGRSLASFTRSLLVMKHSCSRFGRSLVSFTGSLFVVKLSCSKVRKVFSQLHEVTPGYETQLQQVRKVFRQLHGVTLCCETQLQQGQEGLQLASRGHFLLWNRVAARSEKSLVSFRRSLFVVKQGCSKVRKVFSQLTQLNLMTWPFFPCQFVAKRLARWFMTTVANLPAHSLTE